MAIYACLVLPYPPSLNNLFVNNPQTRGRFPSKQYKAWKEEAERAVEHQRPLPQIKGPVWLKFTFGRPDKRKRDVMNLPKAIEDFIVAQGVIEDDSLVEKATVQWSEEVVGCQVEVAEAGEAA